MRPFFCLCPTYGRPPAVIEDTIAQFLEQTYPNRHLFLLDDLGNYPEHYSGFNDQVTWQMISVPTRFATLTAKYNYLIDFIRKHFKPVSDFHNSFFAVWDDDDIYLPGYLAAHAAAMINVEEFACKDERVKLLLHHGIWSHPKTVLSNYSGQIEEESAAGRFHGSLAMNSAALQWLVGWQETKRADFDQIMIRRCQELVNLKAGPAAPPHYLFRWRDSNANHCQGLMSSPDNVDWYDRVQPIHTERVFDINSKLSPSTVYWREEARRFLDAKASALQPL